MHQYHEMENEKGDSEIFVLIIFPIFDNGNISLQVTLAYRLFIRTFLWIGAYALEPLFIFSMYLEEICNAVNSEARSAEPFLHA